MGRGLTVYLCDPQGDSEKPAGAFPVVLHAVCILSTDTVVGRSWKLLVGTKVLRVTGDCRDTFPISVSHSSIKGSKPVCPVLRSACSHLHWCLRLLDWRRISGDVLQVILLCIHLDNGCFWAHQLHSSSVFSSDAHFLSQVICLFLTVWWSYLYILDTNPLSAECVTNIFSQLVPYAFRLFMLFDEFQCPRMCRLFLRCLWFRGF